ncbi:MAG: aspartate--ammonia ligase [Candidatus Marinimicrobia bacterium]|nr:aspartate--ammonia ligase [Candidatus Neomarinimicrobiota bacterium]MDD5230222.1 aspartate--ammonia ligase [Candidatus Neomarinimicrobiota bacterium]MDD5539887.1 aspartate--ammonia ligase [Candidatus Neomarinimicrobiota bacterium]
MGRGLYIPKNYQTYLSTVETEKAILSLKNFFQQNLAFELDLIRVTAPLFVKAGTGINDDLNGVEQPVSFSVKEMTNTRVEVVQSLAKWKRMMLTDLGIKPGKGIYTDMNAIRPDDDLDNLHSIYVDQWDWEKVMTATQRNLDFLKDTVNTIYSVILRTEKYVCHEWNIKPELPEKIAFIHSEELLEHYPGLSPKERERAASKKYGAIFIIGIGGVLKNGEPHDGRAPDYDDWSTSTIKDYRGLNGDIVVYNKVLDCAFELSSMGIRVDKEALVRQLKIRGAESRKDLYFHRRLLNGELPLSIGGGIGQSRLCMYYLRKAHIGEIQSSIWPDAMVKSCRQHNIFLL